MFYEVVIERKLGEIERESVLTGNPEPLTQEQAEELAAAMRMRLMGGGWTIRVREIAE